MSGKPITKQQVNLYMSYRKDHKQKSKNGEYTADRNGYWEPANDHVYDQQVAEFIGEPPDV